MVCHENFYDDDYYCLEADCYCHFDSNKQGAADAPHAASAAPTPASAFGAALLLFIGYTFNPVLQAASQELEDVTHRVGAEAAELVHTTFSFVRLGT